MFILFIEACKHKPEIPKTPDPENKDSTNKETEIPCDPDSVYYSEIQAILNSSCLHAGCHNSDDKADEVDLTNFNSVISTGGVDPGDPSGSDLYERISETGPDKVMPPFPYNTLTSEQIQKVERWIQQGALNNYCDGCDTVNVTYGIQVTNLLESSCVSCHNDNLAQGAVNLSNYSGVKSVVDDTRLLRSVQHDTGVVAMPYLTTKWEDCKIRTIELWINDGAPNN